MGTAYIDSSGVLNCGGKGSGVPGPCPIVEKHSQTTLRSGNLVTHFHATLQSGKRARITTILAPASSQMKVHYIGPLDNAEPLRLSLREARSIHKQVLSHFPDVKELIGTRIGGAKDSKEITVKVPTKKGLSEKVDNCGGKGSGKPGPCPVEKKIYTHDISKVMDHLKFHKLEFGKHYDIDEGNRTSTVRALHKDAHSVIKGLHSHFKDPYTSSVGSMKGWKDKSERADKAGIEEEGTHNILLAANCGGKGSGKPGPCPKGGSPAPAKSKRTDLNSSEVRRKRALDAVEKAPTVKVKETDPGAPREAVLMRGNLMKTPLKTDTNPGFHEKIRKVMQTSGKREIKDVSISSLTARQGAVSKESVKHFINKGERTDEQKWEHPVVVKLGGKHYLYDGTHRVSADYLSGKKTVKAIVHG